MLQVTDWNYRRYILADPSPPVASTPTPGWISEATWPSVGNSGGPFAVDAAAYGDSLMPSTAVGLPVYTDLCTAPHLTGIAKATSTSPTKVRFVSGYRYIEALSLLYPIKRIVNNVVA